MQRKPPERLIALLSLMCGLLAPIAAGAGPYKWQDESGRTVYGDRPPHMDAKQLSGGAFVARTDATASAGSVQALPPALRALAAKSPVVLYSSRSCEPCRVAREHLLSRGVPFTEKTLGTEADVAAFKALGFTEMTVPTLSVGPERLVGFEISGWNRSLDTAGYPARSQLPANWAPARPEPLASAQPAPPARPPGGQVVEQLVRDPAREAPPAAALIQAPPSARDRGLRF